MKKIIILIMVFSICFTLNAEEKPIISVLDFNTEEGISKSEMSLFISLLSSALFQTQIYTVIDVSEREKLLSELEFSVSDCSDESCQLEIGRLLAAEGIIIGTIGRLGTRYVLSIKMLETNTGRAINTADGIYSSIDTMVDDVSGIANKLASVHKKEVEEVVEADSTETGEVVPDTDTEVTDTEVTDTEVADTEVADTEVADTETHTEEVVEDTSTKEATDDIDIRPTPAPKPGKEKFLSFSIALEGGPKFPLHVVGEIFEMGIAPLLILDLELNLGFMNLGLGIVTGVNMEKTLQDDERVINPYELIMIPAGGNIKLTTRFMLPLYIFAEAMGGITYGMVTYTESLQMEGETFIKPFVSAALGAGYAFTKNFRLGLGGAYTIIIFDENPLHGIAPFARVEIHF